MMVSFIDRHRKALGVESTCRTLRFAPSAYYERKRRESDPELRSPRQKADEALQLAIRRVWDDNFQAYGARKVWLQLRREGIGTARCTVERLMRGMGLRGVIRGRNCQRRFHLAGFSRFGFAGHPGSFEADRAHPKPVLHAV
jgi:putative transposase